MHKLAAAIVKEALLVARDVHALAVLFLMPVAFVIIMSLALQDVFRPGAAPQFALAIVDGDRGAIGREIAREVERVAFFRAETIAVGDFAAATHRMRASVRHGERRFVLLIPPGTMAALESAMPASLPLLVEPTVRPEHRVAVQLALDRVVQGIEIELRAARMGVGADGALRTALLTVAPEASPVRQTATQQNVPAYTLLAMFMLVVPLSAAFIRERDQGSLVRLRSMPVTAWVVLGGKIAPYFVVNMLQLALCLAVGRYVLPLLGADALQLGPSIAGLVLLAAAASLAAIGFGLAVALFARTSEQATAFGATAVLVLAALGGIMVPKFVMPQMLQRIADASPLAWALDGFLDLFARGAGAADVAYRAAALTAFALGCLALAAWRFHQLIRSQ